MLKNTTDFSYSEIIIFILSVICEISLPVLTII